MKSLVIAATVFLSILTVSCSAVPPDDESGGKSTDIDASQVESDDISSQYNESSEESSESQSSAESSVSAEISSEQPTSSQEDSSNEASEASVEKSVVGSLFKPYFDKIESGVYMIKTVESRMAGGEALPYIITAYHNGGAVYAVIEESYGSKSEYIVAGGKLTVLDSVTKTAVVMDYDAALFSEKQLWTGIINLTGSGTQMLFNTEYEYETYTDSEGFEFDLFFSNGALKRYRSYDEERKDTIVISLSVSDDISGGVFEVPEGFTVADTTQ